MPEDAKAYFSLATEMLGDPFVLTDMDKATERIARAISSHEKITVYGDYDVDGVTSVTALLLYLKEKGADVSYFIPNRFDDGYGVSDATVTQLASDGTELIVTVDTGITANREVETAKEFDEIKSYPAWNVAQSNPCFEIWLYYHLMETPPEDYDSTKERFKTYLDRVLPGGFNYDRHPVFIEDAIQNAKVNFRTDKDGKITMFSTEMHLLGTEILGFVKRDLGKLKNKLS